MPQVLERSISASQRGKGMSITIELTKDEADLILRWFEEKMPLTSHGVGMRAESVVTKLKIAQGEARGG